MGAVRKRSRFQPAVVLAAGMLRQKVELAVVVIHSKEYKMLSCIYSTVRNLNFPGECDFVIFYLILQDILDGEDLMNFF